MSKSDKEIWDASVKKKNRWLLLKQIKWRVLGHHGLRFTLKRKIKGITDLEWMDYALLIKLICVSMGLTIIKIIITWGFAVYAWVFPPPDPTQPGMPYLMPMLTLLMRYIQ